MSRKLLLALVAPVLVLSACADRADVEAGGVAADAQPVDLLRQAPDRAVDAGSGRIEMVTTLVVDGTTHELTATGAFAGTRARFEMDIAELLAAEDLGGQLPAGADEPMEIVVDGTTTYLRMPLLAAVTGVDGWLSMSAADLGQSGDALGLGAGMSNPLQLLDALRGVSSDVEPIGESGDGERYGYEVTVDLEKAADRLPEAQREEYLQQLGSLGVTELHLEVWLDVDGLVRTLKVDLADMAGASPELAGFESGQLEVRFSDYGADISVAVPDPADVTPFAEVLGSMGGSR